MPFKVTLMPVDSAEHVVKHWNHNGRSHRAIDAAVKLAASDSDTVIRVEGTGLGSHDKARLEAITNQVRGHKIYSVDEDGRGKNVTVVFEASPEVTGALHKGNAMSRERKKQLDEVSGMKPTSDKVARIKEYNLMDTDSLRVYAMTQDTGIAIPRSR